MLRSRLLAEELSKARILSGSLLYWPLIMTIWSLSRSTEDDDDENQINRFFFSKPPLKSNLSFPVLFPKASSNSTPSC